MKINFTPNAELGDFLSLLQEVIPVCGHHLTDRAICRYTAMSTRTYMQLKRAPHQTSAITMQ